jgi:Xaa-Pro aminopeptidase
MHAALEGALHAGERLLHPGAAAGSVDRAVRGSIEAAGYPVYSHHTGHGLGLSQIEPPFIAPGGDTDMRLEPGCVIALEPGIYQPGVGGMRLENVYLVTGGEPELLTGTPAQLLSSG